MSLLEKVSNKEGELLLYYSLDYVSECDDACPKFNKCPEQNYGNKCTIMDEYLQGVSSVIFREYKKDLNEEMLWKLGMHLMPLYRFLCRLKLEESALRSVVGFSSKGTPWVHPIFREIRETIKSIEKTWLTVCPEIPMAPNVRSKNYIDIEDGDPNYYAHLTEQEDKPVKPRKITKRRLTNG